MGYKRDKIGKKCIIKRWLRLIDNLKFMPSSLDTLVKIVKSYRNLNNFCASRWNDNSEPLRLHLKKGLPL
jgi:hypothetical protein